MALLSGMIRNVAITGRTDTLNAWWGGRQGGRWAQQTVRAAFPTSAPQAPPASRRVAHPAEALRDLTALQRSGVLTEAEFDRLRARLDV